MLREATRQRRRDEPPVPFVDLDALHAPLTDELERAWGRVFASRSFIGGVEVSDFESDWATYCGTRYAVGVANGTDALTLTLRGLGIGPGDEVIVPTNTFVATAEAVLLTGATPRFVDVDPDTLLITAEQVDAAVNARTAAVIVVHLYGNVAEMDAICAVAARHGIAVIEDAAQAHGATYRGQRAGSFGIAGCFSFYPAKNLGALGDGGAIVTDDAGLAERIRSSSNHGRANGSWYEHGTLGTNSRLDALQAAFLAVKLSYLDEWNNARRNVARMYRKLLLGTYCDIVRGPEGSEGVHHLLVARLRDRDRVRDILRAKGIETGIHYPVPCHLQLPYAHLADEPLPVSERASAEILSLPMFPQMSPSQIERVALAVRDAVGAKKPSTRRRPR
jgi:dTDP-4-amino-4,6-dideoxygalactose transaminase